MSPSLSAALLPALLAGLAWIANPTEATAAEEACRVMTDGDLQAAKALFADSCPGSVRRDCDPVDGGGWACASTVIGRAAPPIAKPSAAPVPAPAPKQPAPAPAPIETDRTPTERAGLCFSPLADDLSAAARAFASSCAGYVRRDCDPFDGGWRCSSGIIGAAAPGVAGLPDAAPPVKTVKTPSPAMSIADAPAAEAIVPPDPAATDAPSNQAVGRIQAGDLLSLHYDHCPDPDDGHAQAAGLSVVDTLGLTDVLVLNGTCGDGIRDRYDSAGLALSRRIWGGDVLDVAGDRAASIVATADRWAASLANGHRVWVAEGGQSDVTAAVLQRLAERSPELDLKRVTVVQHSAGKGAYNEDFSERLDEVRSRASYRTVPNGNVGGNGSADLAMQSSAFVERARAGRYRSAWTAAFDYLRPDCASASYRCKLDFSDTVELLWIVGDTGTRTVDDFADRYLD